MISSWIVKTVDLQQPVHCDLLPLLLHQRTFHAMWISVFWWSLAWYCGLLELEKQARHNSHWVGDHYHISSAPPIFYTTHTVRCVHMAVRPWLALLKWWGSGGHLTATSTLVRCRTFRYTSWKLSKESGSFESPSARLKRSFQLLGLEQDECAEEEIRKAYIRLVKKYHPDSSSGEADADHFSEVRVIIMNVLIKATLIFFNLFHCRWGKRTRGVWAMQRMCRWLVISTKLWNRS